MTYVETPMSVGEAFPGRGSGAPVGPTDRWSQDAVDDYTVGERPDPAWLQPVLRDGIDSATLRSARGSAYVMLRSPDDGDGAGYLRLTPEEWELAQLMDGTHTVARLVAEFARIAGRLAPDEVRRVVADLAGSRMLEELPAGSLRTPASRSAGVLHGRRVAVVGVDGIFAALHRTGGRFLFTRAAAVVLSLVSLAGLGVFAATWWRGTESVFLTSGSYLLGAVVLLVFGAFVGVCRELGRGLATKHAGRAVPTAGLLVRLGLPALRVDTSDVWMAGRRARLRVTAAGPFTVAVLAGAAQLIGLVVPPLAGPAFSLAFVCYLHLLVQLNPLLPLDGYHLVMDWLEIPALRARALSWLGGRLRRRPRGFAALDSEGRLIALYGLLAAFWLAVTAGAVYRIWTDRLAGLATGLWPDGAAARLLLVAVLIGTCAPLLRQVAGRADAALRRYRSRIAERRREADAPRRLAALRASELGGLPEPALASLAARARWLHPGTGRQIVVAGGSPAAVYVVVEGALQARRPGDPGGTVRHHVGSGGVVGLADALTGRQSALDWHTAGTTLLALPTAAVATVVGPIPGPPADDRTEAEALFADTPALACFSDDERLALIAAAHPVDLAPGAPVLLSGPTHAVVVESGVIALPDGVELRRGTLVGPVGVGEPGMVAQARTPVRLWVMPDAASLPPLVGAAQRAASGPLPAPRPASPTDGDPGVGYPPLAAPPGPPQDVDQGLDQRFERGMWWLVGSAVLAALMFVGTGFIAGPAWAEMPTGRVQLAADGGAVTAVVAGTTVRMGPGDERYLPVGARFEVGAGSTGRMTFRGGGAVVLCAGTQGAVTRLTADGDNRSPRATLVVDSGRLLADTTATGGAFAPLALTVISTTGEVRNVGGARYAVEPSTVAVAAGQVRSAGAAVAPTGTDLGCGAVAPTAPPAPDAPTESPTTEPTLDQPSEEPSDPTPSETESTTDAPEETATAEPTRTRDSDDEPDPEPEPERTTVRPRPVPSPTRPDPTRPIPRPTTPSPKPTTSKPTTAKPTTAVPTIDPTIDPPVTIAPTAASGAAGKGPTAGAAAVAVSPSPGVGD